MILNRGLNSSVVCMCVCMHYRVKINSKLHGTTPIFRVNKIEPEKLIHLQLY